VLASLSTDSTDSVIDTGHRRKRIPYAPVIRHLKENGSPSQLQAVPTDLWSLLFQIDRSFKQTAVRKPKNNKDHEREPPARPYRGVRDPQNAQKNRLPRPEGGIPSFWDVSLFGVPRKPRWPASGLAPIKESLPQILEIEWLEVLRYEVPVLADEFADFQ